MKIPDRLLFSRAERSPHGNSAAITTAADDGTSVVESPATAQIFLNNLSDRPIAYKLKTNKRDAFKVTPCAHGVIDAKSTIRLVLNWTYPLSSLPTEEWEKVRSSSMLLLQTRFIHDAGSYDPNKAIDPKVKSDLAILQLFIQTWQRYGDNDGVTETKIAADVCPMTTGGGDVGDGSAYGRERYITRAQVFLEDSTDKEGNCHKRLMVDQAVETEPVKANNELTPVVPPGGSTGVTLAIFGAILAVAIYFTLIVCFKFNIRF